jgi:hypothetical protein
VNPGCLPIRVQSYIPARYEEHNNNNIIIIIKFVCFLHYATSRKVAGSIPDEVIRFFNRPNPSSRTMALGSNEPLTEMSTRNIPGSEGRPARGVDNLTAICEPTV